MSTMMAAVFQGEGKLALEEVPVPRVERPHDVLLEVEAVGICGTDLHILHVPPGLRANPGIVLGHEYTGRVVQVGDAVDGCGPGDRVVVDPNVTCGRCGYCRRGIANMCPETSALGVHVDGGLARYNVAPAPSLHRVPDGMPPDRAVLAEPLACVTHGVDRLRPRPGDSAVVLGAGPIGLLFTQLLLAAGVAPLLVVEPATIRRRQALANGAHHVADPTREDLAEVVRREMGIGADLAVDAVGTQLDRALPLLRRGGTALVFGQNENSRVGFLGLDVSRYELTIVGSHIAPFCFPRAISLLEQGTVDSEKLVSHRMGLDQIHEGLDLLRAGEAVKVVIDPRQA